MLLSTLEAGVVNHRRDGAVSVDCQMEVFVDKQVVAGTLADDLEVVYKRSLKRHRLRIGLELRFSCGLVLGPGCLPQAAYSLGLEVAHHVETARPVKGEAKKDMEGAVQHHQLPRAGDIHDQGDGNRCICRHGSLHRQYSATHYQSRDEGQDRPVNTMLCHCCLLRHTTSVALGSCLWTRACTRSGISVSPPRAGNIVHPVPSFGSFRHGSPIQAATPRPPELSGWASPAGRAPQNWAQ